MSDRLAALLRHFTVQARTFHAGPLCGFNTLEAVDGCGQLHWASTRCPVVPTPDVAARHGVSEARAAATTPARSSAAHAGVATSSAGTWSTAITGATSGGGAAAVSTGTVSGVIAA